MFNEENQSKKIMNCLSLTLVLIGCITFISAVTIDAGSCETIPIETSNKIFWTASGNSSSIDGIEINQDGSNITICLDPMFQEDNLSIILIEEQTKEVIREVHVSGGGGGSSTRWRTEYVDRNVTEYLDREVLKEMDPVEIDRLVKSSKWWLGLWVVVALVVGFFIAKFSYKKENSNIVVREEEKNE